MDKERRYADLIEKRKKCDLCLPYLRNASRIKGGCLDCDEIGAYSQWQGNPWAKLMVVGQDFAGIDGFCVNRGWPGAAVETNMRLTERLADAGITIKLPDPNREDCENLLFFHNAILCMKEGGMRETGKTKRVPEWCYKNCREAFLKPIIELISPRLVVTLGARTMKSVNAVFDPKPHGQLPAADAVPKPTRLFDRTWLMPVYHPMASRPTAAQQADWREVGHVLAQVASDSPSP